MNTEEMRHVIRLIVDSLKQLEQAKEDHKAKEQAALELHDLDPKTVRAIKAIAKAVAANKLDVIEQDAQELADMIAAVREGVE